MITAEAWRAWSAAAPAEALKFFLATPPMGECLNLEKHRSVLEELLENAAKVHITIEPPPE